MEIYALPTWNYVAVKYQAGFRSLLRKMLLLFTPFQLCSFGINSYQRFESVGKLHH